MRWIHSCMYRLDRERLDFGSLSESEREDLAARHKQLRNVRVAHERPPVTLGVRAAGLVNKLRAVMHRICLEVEDHIDLLGWTASLGAWVTDMGVELGLGQLQHLPLASVLQPWRQLGADFRMEPDSGGAVDDNNADDVDGFGEHVDDIVAMREAAQVNFSPHRRRDPRVLPHPRKHF